MDSERMGPVWGKEHRLCIEICHPMSLTVQIVCELGPWMDEVDRQMGLRVVRQSFIKEGTVSMVGLCSSLSFGLWERMLVWSGGYRWLVAPSHGGWDGEGRMWRTGLWIVKLAQGLESHPQRQLLERQGVLAERVGTKELEITICHQWNQRSMQSKLCEWVDSLEYWTLILIHQFQKHKWKETNKMFNI